MNAATLREKVVLGLFVSAIAWSSNRLIDATRHEAASQATSHAQERESDDLKARIAALERNCKP